jgi:hypothetical protein
MFFTHASVICRVTENWTRDTVNSACHMTSCSPSFLCERITKNCTYCRLSTTYFPSFSFVRGLTSFLVGGLGIEDGNRMSSAKFRSNCWLVTSFCGAGKAGSVPIKNTNISWTETTYSKYFCRCSSWFLKEKRSALSRLQKCAKYWGLCWSLTLNDTAWSQILY